jgi:hypothetical protein
VAINLPQSEYSLIAVHLDRRVDCGTVLAASVMEAIERVRTAKRDWAAKALGCRAEQIVWEAKEEW